MPGLVPGIHVLLNFKREKTWMAGTSPAMTKVGLVQARKLDALKHSRRLLAFQFRLPLPERRE